MRFFRYSLFFALIFSITFFSYSLVFKSYIGNYANRNNHQATTESTSAIYTLSEYKGRVAVFYNNNSSPDEIYDSFLDSLPEDDVIALKEGITVFSKEELQQLLEDYTS